MGITRAEEKWRQSALATPRHPLHCYRCSLPGLAEFTISRREGTNADHHKTNHYKMEWGIMAE